MSSVVGFAGRLPARLIRRAGRAGCAATRHAGGVGLMLGHTARVLVTGRVSLRGVVDQVYAMGVQSLPLVLVTAALSGIVTSQQGGYQFTGSVPLYVLGSVVTSSVVLELGPVMTAFVLIGRVGARITAELGTMRVSEQIDALESLGRDPIAVLAAPRIVAGVVVTPILVVIADAIGVFAGMIAARSTLDLGSEGFLYGARLFWHDWDFFYSILKGLAFGLVLPLLSSHMGLLTRGGAEGVGRSTTSSVVFMIVAVLAIDALFPPLLLG